MSWFELLLAGAPEAEMIRSASMLALRIGLLLVVAWTASRLVRGATSRHLIWTAALGVLLLLPLGMLAPAVAVEGLPTWLVGASQGEWSAPRAAPEVAPPASVGRGSASTGNGSEDSPAVAIAGSVTARAGSTRAGTAGLDAAPPGPATGGATEQRAMAASSGSGRGGLSRLGALLTALWLTGVVFMTARLFAGLLARRRLLAAARHVGSGRRERLDRLAARIGVERPVRLMESDRIEVPITWGVGAPIVLLPTAARSWSGSLVDSVLLHELAHVRRFDAVVGLLAAVVRLIYWPHPMVWWAYRALRRESERAADDVVIRTSGSPVLYAEHLLEVVRGLRGSAPRAVAAMARRPQVTARIGAILDDSEHRSGPSRRARCLLVAGALIGLFVTAVPVVPAAGPSPERGAFVGLGLDASLAGNPGDGFSAAGAKAAASDRADRRVAREADEVSDPETPGRAATLFDESCGGGSTSHSVTVVDGEQSIRMATGRCEIRIESSGTVEFTSDERGIQRMSPGSRLVIAKRGPDGRQRMKIEPGAADEIAVAWTVDGERWPFDATAEAWLARMIPEIFRLTGWQAEERVARIHSAGGVEAVLDEIARIGSDHVQATYLLALLEQARLEGEQLERWLDLAGRGLGSDHELGRVLQAVPLDRLSDPAVQTSFVEAASTIGSDHGLRRTLEHLLGPNELSTELLRPLLRVAGSIGSDFELAELLVAVCQRFPADQALPEEFYEVAATIGSDYEMRRALAQLSGRPMASGDVARALSLATDIGSDFELAELLIDLLSRLPDDQPLPVEFYDAASTIGSDHEMRRVLVRTIDRPLEAESLVRLLEVSRQIGSDFELAEFLIGLLRRHGEPAGARQAFETTLDTIGSSSERARVRAVWQGADA